MKHTVSEHGHEVARAVQEMLLEEDGDDELPEKYKMSALKQFLQRLENISV